MSTTPPLSVAQDRIEPAGSSAERLGQVITAINNKSAEAGITVYATGGSGSISVGMLVDKVDASEKPVDFDLRGFGISITGLDLPVAHLETQYQLNEYYADSANLLAYNVQVAPDESHQKAFEDAIANVLEEHPTLAAIV